MGWFLCLSVRMIELKNCWTDLGEILYGLYAARNCPKIVIFNYLQSVIPTWRTNELLMWDRVQPTGVGSIVDQQWGPETPTVMQKWVHGGSPLLSNNGTEQLPFL
jgi:hypothetical protein